MEIIKLNNYNLKLKNYKNKIKNYSINGQIRSSNLKNINFNLRS